MKLSGQALRKQVRAVSTCVVAVWTLIGFSHADEFYVDVVHGSDANGGSSWSDAWRTIRFATTTIPDPPSGEVHTVHVAEGVYALSTGEVFPVIMRTGLRLEGAGVGRTILDGEGTAWPLMRPPASPAPFLDAFEASGLTLRDAGNGVDATPSPGEGLTLTLRDVEIVGMSSEGIPALLEDSSSIYLILDRVSVRDCLGGLVLVNADSHNGIVVLANDCEFLDNRDTGVFMLAGGSSSGDHVELKRCRIERNWVAGIQFLNGMGCCHPLEAYDCSISQNRGHGVWANSGQGVGSVALVRCTLADNALDGLRTAGPQGYLTVSLEACILWGNRDDVRDPGGLVNLARFNDVGDGDYVGADRNISADPRFVDAENGDYRLSWGSPCVDVGPLTTPAGTTDLVGAARDVDGNLDHEGRTDLGALEFRPLQFAEPPRVGGELALEVRGPPLADGTIWRSLQALVPPASTPFGEFELDPTDAAAWQDVRVGVDGTVTYRRRIPDLPSLVGRTLSFQTLIHVGGAAGSAWSNPLTVTLAY